MGLDVYSGCLVRYYSRNWKTAVQQWAEQNGVAVNVVRANDAEPVPVEVITDDVTSWRDKLLSELSEYINYPVIWNEDNDITDYYTDKPDWCAFHALLLFFAARYLGETVPDTVPKDFTVFEHPLYKKFMKITQNQYSLYECEWWLPVRDTLMFPAVLPTGHERTLATVGLLESELREINAIDWKAGEKTILSWTQTQGYPTDGYFRDGKAEMGEIHTEYDTVSLAKFAFSILWQAVAHSKKHGTLIILDY